jgi:ABC-type dipeptide/oligopeptide/nickel transport system permease component
VLSYIINRLLASIPALVGASAITFFSPHILAPADLIEQSLSDGAATGDAPLKQQLLLKSLGGSSAGLLRLVWCKKFGLFGRTSGAC